MAQFVSCPVAMGQFWVAIPMSNSIQSFTREMIAKANPNKKIAQCVPFPGEAVAEAFSHITMKNVEKRPKKAISQEQDLVEEGVVCIRK